MNNSAKGLTHLSDAPTSRINLYPDFILTNDNCASEPIHRPMAIQGGSHLLVIDTKGIPVLHSISAELVPCLGCTTESLWNDSPNAWLPESIVRLIDDADLQDYTPQCLPETLLLSGEAFQVTHHRQGGRLIIEFEPEAAIQVDTQIILSAANAFTKTDDPESLYSEATRQVAQAFGYDRVMIYQFDYDGHGCVVGEHKRDHLEPFLGLHYPETDIPKIARELFLRIKSRAIPDVNVHNVPLLINPESGSGAPYLDLSYAQVRATSPIHIQYLQNMGVAASLTFSIIIHGKLWGLIACHHCSPRQVMFSDKLIGEIVAELLAKKIIELENETRSRQEAISREAEDALLNKVVLSENYRVQILEHASVLIKLCKADGAALISLDECVVSTGFVPSDSKIMQIREWLISEGHDDVYRTSNFVKSVAVSMDEEKPIGGMLSTCISTLSNSYLLWFRHPVSKLVDWAGDPANSYSTLPAENGKDVHLTPRQSFSKWQVAVEGQSERWEDSALDMAERVRLGIFKKELLLAANLVKRSNSEFMQVTFAAAHDLQEPLRTQKNYLELAKESLMLKDYDDLLHYIDKTENASTRMSELITDLLRFSQLGLDTKREAVDLESHFKEIIEELTVKLSETQTRLTIGELPCVVGDSEKIKQLLRNLLTNAIKYVAPGTVPEVSVFMEQEGSFWTLNVSDNGIGIDPKYHHLIFSMFKRLHGREEYDGSGIGLAICAKVAESMNAEIGLKSALNQGSTFWIRFHKSSIMELP